MQRLDFLPLPPFTDLARLGVGSANGDVKMAKARVTMVRVNHGLVFSPQHAPKDIAVTGGHLVGYRLVSVGYDDLPQRRRSRRGDAVCKLKRLTLFCALFKIENRGIENTCIVALVIRTI